MASLTAGAITPSLYRDGCFVAYVEGVEIRDFETACRMNSGIIETCVEIRCHLNSVKRKIRWRVCAVWFGTYHEVEIKVGGNKSFQLH